MKTGGYSNPFLAIIPRWAVAIFSWLGAWFWVGPAAADESVIRLVEPYEWRIIGIIALCVVEALLIVALLVQQQRRHGVETELRDSEERMTLAATAAKLGMWVWDITHDQILGDRSLPGAVWFRSRRASRLPGVSRFPAPG